MVINNIERYVAVGKELILYSKKGIDTQIDLKIRYRINKEGLSLERFSERSFFYCIFGVVLIK